jgi:dTDP-4-dehydrorhamnose reductase
MRVEKMTSKDLDVSTVSFNELITLFQNKKCKFVVNCAGLIKQRLGITTEKMFAVNTNFPIMLAKVCWKLNMTMIHPSTDCIFSGKTPNLGGYAETDIPDAQDVYGKSKALAETNSPNVITIRTSIIGEEDPNSQGLSLLEWCRKNREKTVQGYTTHHWNGITCLEWAKKAFYLLNKYSNGLFTITSKPITKYDLVHIISDVYELDMKIEPVAIDYCNRILLTNENGTFGKRDIYELLKEMREYKID